MLGQALLEYLPILIHTSMRSLVIFIAALGIVYIVGRMLEIVNSDRGRNAVALLVIFPLSYWSVIMYDLDIIVHPLEVYWRTLVYGSSACVLFVLIGWKLFSRIDNLLDNKIAPDDDDKKRRKKK